MQLYVSAALKHAIASLDERGKDQVRQAVLQEAQRLLAQPPGPARARELHRRLDAAIQTFLAQRPDLAGAIRCGRGCSHCCRVFVGITRDEAQLLAEAVRIGGVSFAAARMESQRHWTSNQDFATHSREEAACVFLREDGCCGVYADRPAACRALLVASDPEFCREADSATRIMAIINPRAEGLVSAARSADASGDSLPLARRLWEALQA
jgi:Fe-S-cluster containining protein